MLWAFVKSHYRMVALTGLWILSLVWVSMLYSPTPSPQIKLAQAGIVLAKQQQVQIEQTSQKAIVNVQKRLAAIKTPQQAIDAIPDLSGLPVASGAKISLPAEDVAFKALDFAKYAAQCKEDQIALAACQNERQIDNMIQNDQATEIKTLARGPSFLSKLKSGAIKVGIGVALGVIFVKY